MDNLARAEKRHETQKMEALGQLTGGIAHDFNNLLTVIRSNAEHLRDELKGQNLSAETDMILKATMRGAGLVQRLLAFARKQELRPQYVDLEALVESFTKLLRHAIEENVAVAVRKPSRLPAISVDPNGLENALLNIAINARDAMPNGGQLSIDLFELRVNHANGDAFPELAAGPYVGISISDTGHGMPADVLAKATQRFFTTKEPGKGTGLGLSMVYDFANQSQGAVKIRSEVGCGTTVSLYFPPAKPTERRAVTRAMEARDGLRGAGCILLVEDDSLVRESTQAILCKLGYSVTTAGTAAEALAILERLPDVDLIFSDIIIPGKMTGVDLVNETRHRWPAIKTLLTSGYSKTDALGRISVPAHARFLPKPYSNTTLAAAIRDLLRDAKG